MELLTLNFQFILTVLLFATVFCKYAKENFEYHPCIRQCTEKTMLCYYKFEVERYYTLSKACYNCPYNITDCYRRDCVPTDGVERLITVVNRSLPGPGIQVCLGDRIIVDVVNSMVKDTTAIHWHGLHQTRTPYMDGVPFITQCPIPPGTSFRYEIYADIPGTHFWHSHAGIQRGDGVFGPLIIRQPRYKEVHSSLYDHDLPEHVIVLNDWTHIPIDAKFESHYQSSGTNKPDNILVNGVGKYREFKAKNDKIVHTPLATFTVQQGKRYRFRVINSGVLYCPFEFSVDNHTMIVINSDGGEIQPVYVDSLISYAGERWDFILNTNNKIGNYWFRIRGLMDCGENFNKVFATAVLHYVNASNTYPTPTVYYNNTERNGLQLNPINKGPGYVDYVNVVELTNEIESVQDISLKETPDISLMLAFDFYPTDNSLFQKHGLYGFNEVPAKYQRYTPQINHVSMKMPSFPLLSEPEHINSNTFCNTSNFQKCNKTFCYCTYLIEIPLNSVVEITLVDEGLIYESNHPFHFHGYVFRVIALEKLGNSTTAEEVNNLDKQGKISRNFFNPPIKDTVTVPDGGYTIIRFYANNPGYWLMHCHLDFHVETGMAVIFKIGSDSDIPPLPANFPKCGNYYRQMVTNFTGDTDHQHVTDRYQPDNTVEESAIAGIWERIKNAFTTSSASLPYFKTYLFTLPLLLPIIFVKL